MAQTFSGVSEAEAAIRACEALGIGRSNLRYKVVTRDAIDRRVVIEIDEAATLAAKTEKRTPPRRDGSGSDRRGGRGGRPRHDDENDSFSDTLAEEYKEFREMTAAPKTPVAARPAIAEAGLSPRAHKALAVTRHLLALGQFSAHAQISVDNEEQVLVDLHGEDEGLIIGRKGETLLALQFMVNRLVARESEGSEKIAVDCEAYRARRQEALRVLALKLGEKAKHDGKIFTVSPMNAHDRRIFHLTLDGQNGLKTRSEGEGLMRRVMIIPDGAEHS